jgi:uncharacterized protein YprB with RNaseH-like and TPR domain
MALVFDIETVGEEFDELDELTQNDLTHWIEREAAGNEEKQEVLRQNVKDRLGLSPLTAQVVSIGIFDTDRDQGAVYFQAPDKEIDEQTKGNIIYKPQTEKQMLESFWQVAKRYNEFVSFNGRNFDAPFLMIRSAIYKIRPSLDLMADRYLREYTKIKHIDLLEQLSFYGATSRRSLHLYCRAFGIASPKTNDIKGSEVARLFQAQQYLKIAEYNAADILATAQLFEFWHKYLRFF